MDGEIMWFGLPSVDTDIDMRFISSKRKAPVGGEYYGAQDEAEASSFRAALDLIASGAIDVGPLLVTSFQ